jgi:OmpA family protein
MKRTGDGAVDAYPTNWRWEKDTLWAEATVLLYNFDVDGTDLKKGHTDFLNEQVVFFLDDGAEARVKIAGTASLSGESGHNDDLSEKRAKAVMNHLASKGIGSMKFQPTAPIALGDAPSGPAREDDRDRAVTLYLKFPITIEDLFLFTDDWATRLDWDDVIGMDTADHGKKIEKINIEITGWGAPRYWVLAGSKRVLVMPEDIPVRLRSRSPIRAWGYSTILLPKWFHIPMKDPSAPYDFRESRTKYRLSIPIGDAGDFLTVVEGEVQEVSTVVKSGNKSDAVFRTELGWASRGIAEQPSNVANDSGDERVESVAALRLLQAGGVEVLEVEGMTKAKKDPKKGLAKRLIRSPADVFYYSGAASDDGCLAIGKDCWASPKDLLDYWKPPFDLEVLILAGSSVLAVHYPNGSPKGPGTEWSALLKRWGGPLTAILGYRGTAPFDRIEGSQIATLMGKKIAAGLNADQWVQVWLQLHANPDQKRLPEFRNAVGMDEKGYWWIGKRNGARQFLGDPKKLDYDYSINGPEPLI